MITRNIRRSLLVCVCLALLAVWPRIMSVGATVPPGLEHYIYQLDFLMFKNIAEGELRLDSTGRPDTQRAELVGRTLGLASWLAGNRVQRYIATMEEQEDGTLRSLTYESQVSKRRFGRGKTTRKRFQFDVEARQVILEKEKNGSFVSKKVFDVPDGPLPVDILTGFYNLRKGVYGPLLAGNRLEVPTVTSKGLSTIIVDVLTPEQSERRDFFPESGVLLQITLDPEVFETTDGGLFLWLDPAGLPARGIVGDVVGLGDVKGYLRHGRGR